MRKVDAIAAVLLLVLVAVVVFVIIPRENSGGVWHGLSPYFYPMVMLAGLAFGSAGLLVQALTRPNSYDDQSKTPVTREELGFFLLAGTIVLVATFVIHKFGFWIGGPVLIAGIMVFMGEVRPLRIALVAAPTIVATWVLVTWVLKIPLP